jgi:hypothetical protein
VITVAGNTATVARTVARAVGAGVNGAASSADATPQRRSTPTRAEDVLSAASKASPAGPSRWWSRADQTAPIKRLAATPARPACEPDLSEVSSTLSRFYGGVGRATAEDET